MGLTKILRHRDGSTLDIREQKIFTCPKCDNELFLKMRFCDKCGSRIEWPEEYHHLINPGSGRNKRARTR
jgi:DNA-directed RNA polymerase subunit M/transcription elongation factor TFIIS